MVLLVLNFIKKHLTVYCLLGLFIMANFKMLLCVSIFQCDICVLYLSILLLMAFGWVTIEIYKMIPDCFSKYLYHFITLLTACKIATLHSFSWTLNIDYFLFFFFSFLTTFLFFHWTNVKWNLMTLISNFLIAAKA